MPFLVDCYRTDDNRFKTVSPHWPDAKSSTTTVTVTGNAHSDGSSTPIVAKRDGCPRTVATQSVTDLALLYCGDIHQPYMGELGAS